LIIRTSSNIHLPLIPGSSKAIETLKSIPSERESKALIREHGRIYRKSIIDLDNSIRINMAKSGLNRYSSHPELHVIDERVNRFLQAQNLNEEEDDETDHPSDRSLFIVSNNGDE